LITLTQEMKMPKPVTERTLSSQHKGAVATAAHQKFIRQDLRDAEEKAKTASEDDARRARDDATDLVHTYEKQLDEALRHKTDEIMEV